MHEGVVVLHKGGLEGWGVCVQWVVAAGWVVCCNSSLHRLMHECVLICRITLVYVVEHMGCLWTETGLWTGTGLCTVGGVYSG